MTWRGVPVFGLFLFLMAGLALGPAAIAAADGDGATAGAFAFSAIVILVAALLFSLAAYRRAGGPEVRAEFITLFAVLILGPLFAALPMAITLPRYPLEALYFEMVSCFTTTGASIFDRPGQLPEAVNLWRAVCAWLGGLIALVMAFAILAPRNLGGYEVRGAQDRTGAVGRLRGVPVWAGGQGREAAGDRVIGTARAVLPVYGLLTAALAACLMATGFTPFLALLSAMSLVSTSGVQFTDAGMFAETGTRAEVLVVVFLVFASSRHLFRSDEGLGARLAEFRGDPEMRLLLGVVVGVSLVLFLRHWIGALDLPADGDLAAPAAALWGGFFTVLSFATTTGVESANWDEARAWSGLGNPGLILIGLAIMGGGIASTAGGVKLLRAYALFKHGQREMERLVRPSSISGSGASKRGLRREGAQIAWVFLMLYLVALGLTMLALSLTGLGFETGLVAATAALSNTGPLLGVAVDDARWMTSISAEGRGILVAAMILGRVETLAIIAMLNPGYWR